MPEPAQSRPIVLSGADLVLPDRVMPSGSLMIRDGRIEAVESGPMSGPSGSTRIDLSGHVIVPGFVDVHVHGVLGVDVLDGPAAVTEMAAQLPRFGVTAFCPTTVACAPPALTALLESVDAARRTPSPRSARVLPAHLESNFINPEWKGAQPLACLRHPGAKTDELIAKTEERRPKNEGAFTGRDILSVVAAHRSAVGIVTLAPEIPGGLDLVRELVAAGHRVSIGHTGATYDEARAAIAAGVRHATHLFNRMSPSTARAPGVVGAALESDEVFAELICDGFHVHPALIAQAVRLKSAWRVLAITDGTAGSGLPVGTRTRLGGQVIIVTSRTAELEDGTLAGSVLTMDRAFRLLVEQVHLSLTDAARLCATTPAAAMGLLDTGQIAAGLSADLVVLGPDLGVRQTFVAGLVAWEP